MIVALASLWMVYGGLRLRFRATVAPLLILGAAYGFDRWRQTLQVDGEFHEILASAVAATATVSTLRLFKLYGTPGNQLPSTAISDHRAPQPAVVGGDAFSESAAGR